MVERLSAWPRWARCVVAFAVQAFLAMFLKGIKPYAPLGEYAMLYIVLTMAIAYLLGKGPAALTVVSGFLAYLHFFVPPIGSIWPLADSLEGWYSIPAWHDSRRLRHNRHSA